MGGSAFSPDVVRASPISRFAGLAALLPLLSSCGAVLDPQGPVGGNEKSILLISLVVMLFIVVPTIGAAVVFGWWFRSSNRRATRRPEFVYSGRIELVVWAIPLLTIMFLGGIAWTGSHALEPSKPLSDPRRPIEIQVVALDWKWLFIYPDEGVASVNRVVVPVGAPVHFRITSASVMNAFFVPRLGSMIYAMNGMATQLNLRADHEGVFAGLSSHFSGDGFSDMHFTVDAVPRSGFDAWIAGAKGNGPVLDGAGYVALAHQSSNVRPFTYRAASPHMFDAIVTQAIAPGPGPEGRAASDVHPKNAES